jgi:hypothetical protein
MSNWHRVNQRWEQKTKTQGPSLRMWWVITSASKKRRWIVKNLKGFVEKNYTELVAPHYRVNSPWIERDKQFFYEELSRWGRNGSWRAEKPKTHKELYNCLGSANLALYKGYYEKEVPYDSKAYKSLCESGITPDVKQFWKGIEFTL